MFSKCILFYPEIFLIDTSNGVILVQLLQHCLKNDFFFIIFCRGKKKYQLKLSFTGKHFTDLNFLFTSPLSANRLTAQWLTSHLINSDYEKAGDHLKSFKRIKDEQPLYRR